MKTSQAHLLCAAPLLALLITGRLHAQAPAAPEPPVDPALPAGVELDPETARVLEELKKVEETVQNSRSKNNFAAVEIIRQAAGSEAAAVELWMDSTRDVDFKIKDRKEAEWRQQRDRLSARLGQPGGATAIKMNLQYLLLTIKAASAAKPEEKDEVMKNLVGFLEDAARAARELLPNQDIFHQQVLSTPVARRFKLDQTVQVRMPWAPTPELTAAYESALLPYYREKGDPAQLQQLWTRRLQQEAAWVAARENEFEKHHYREFRQPSLEFSMALDLYKAGKADALQRMMQIIQQNPGHKDAPHWLHNMKQAVIARALAQQTQTAPAGGTTPPEPPEDTTAGGGGTTPPEVPSPNFRPSPQGFPPSLRR